MIDDDNDITKYKTDIPILCVSNLLWVLASWVLIKQKAVKQHKVIFVALDFLMIGFKRSNLMDWSKEQNESTSEPCPQKQWKKTNQCLYFHKNHSDWL